jgi:hypothetical protein
MRKHVLVVLAVLVAAGAAAVVLASGSAAIAATSVPVDFGDCAFNTNGVTTVPAGVPIDVTDTGGGAAGNYGTALHAWQSTGTSTATIAVTGGATTTISLVDSFPQYFGDPYFAWLTFGPDISLDPLAPGGSVLVTIDSTNTAGGEVVFPEQKYPAPHFGPFHISRGDTSEAQCLITASS